MGPGENGLPTFEPFATPLLAEWDFGTGPQMLPLVCLTIDKPAISDMDGDGDIDIVAFTEISTTLYRFSGQLECDLAMVCTNRCYGMFTEGTEDNTLFIGDAHECSFNVVDPRDRPDNSNPAEMWRDGMHAGGAVTIMQLDGSQLADALISDMTYPTASALIMEDAIDGQDSTAWVDEAFPALLPHTGPADSLNLPRFPAAYPFDVDEDGDLDLICSPNTSLESDDDASVHLWLNEGTLDQPVWQFSASDWMQRDMLDFGRGAAPYWVDLDNDGDLDLAISNKERYEGIGITPSDLALIRNIGTTESPAFELADMHAINFQVNGIESVHAAWGDLDGDGDVDLIVGDELGLLHRYINTSELGAWPVFQMDALSMTDANGTAIDVGQFATPQLIDINGDGLLDLLIGEKNGTLTLYEGCGDSDNLEWCLFESLETGVNWADILVDNALGINGYSVPCLYQDGNGLHVFVANELGRVQAFGTVDDANPYAILNETSEALGGFEPGLRAAATLGDVNNDGIPELLIGIQNGGLLWYQGTATDIAGEAVTEMPSEIYPNPVTVGSKLQIRGNKRIEHAGSWQWLSINGQVQPASVIHQNQYELSLAAPAVPGIYLLRNLTSDSPHMDSPVCLRVIVVPN